MKVDQTGAARQAFLADGHGSRNAIWRFCAKTGQVPDAWVFAGIHRLAGVPVSGE
jgi:hypothetical protein